MSSRGHRAGHCYSQHETSRPRKKTVSGCDVPKIIISDGPSVNEITREWIEVFDGCVMRGEVLRDSAFWRLALYHLPEGVDPNHPEVIDALVMIRESVESKPA
jgi:hypothetical protein